MRVGEERVVGRGLCSGRPAQMKGAVMLSQPQRLVEPLWGRPPPLHVLQLFLALGCAEHATEK